MFLLRAIQEKEEEAKREEEKKEEEKEVEQEKEEETRSMKKNREKIYHMCFDCRKGIIIVE